MRGASHNRDAARGCIPNAKARQKNCSHDDHFPYHDQSAPLPFPDRASLASEDRGYAQTNAGHPDAERPDALGEGNANQIESQRECEP